MSTNSQVQIALQTKCQSELVHWRERSEKNITCFKDKHPNMNVVENI